MFQDPTSGVAAGWRGSMPTLCASLALGLSLGLSGCQEPETPDPLAPRPIAWAEVGAADSSTRRTLSGVVRAVQRAPLSFQVGGRIETIDVEVGDHFVADDVLARLDRRTYRLAREERASELTQAEAALREAEQAFARQRDLHADGWASQATFDTARAALDTAQGRLETARARLDIAEEDLNDTVLRAPYPGVVAQRLAEPAQQIRAGETVLHIQGNGGGFEIALALPETLVGRLRPGDVQTVTFPARPGAPARARVTEIGTEAVQGSAFPVTLRLLTARTDLRAGMTAEVAFEIAAASAEDGTAPAGAPVAIPVTAFLPGDGAETVVFVFHPGEDPAGPGTLERRAVTLGPVTSDHVVVRDGLAGGELVATRGLPFLRDGQTVTRLGVGPVRYE